MIEKKLDDTALEALTVDAGALFFARPFLPPADLAQAKIAARGIAAAYAGIGYQAINVGRRDLAAGVGFLKKIAEQHALPLVSANLKNAANESLFPTSLVRTVAGTKIAITGITDHNGALPEGNNAISIASWRTVLPETIARLRSQADMVILLSNYPPRENLAIAGEVNGIDIIIQSGHSGANMGPKRKKNTVLLQTEKRGKYLGMFRVRWNGSGPWLPMNKKRDQLVRLKQELDGLKWQIRRRARKLDRHRQEDDAIYRKLVQEEKELRQLIRSLKKKQKTVPKETAPHTGPLYANSFIPLPLTVPEDLDIRKIVLETEQQVALLGKRSRPAKRARLPLVGWRACAGCHEPQTTFWKQTAHFTAYQTLVDKKKETTLACLPCHVTAPAKNMSTDTAQLLSMPDDLRGITCEACHGPGALHVTAPRSHSMRRRPSPATCLACHTPERDDHFVFRKDSGHIACPAPRR